MQAAYTGHAGPDLRRLHRPGGQGRRCAPNRAGTYAHHPRARDAGAGEYRPLDRFTPAKSDSLPVPDVPAEAPSRTRQGQAESRAVLRVTARPIPQLRTLWKSVWLLVDRTSTQAYCPGSGDCPRADGRDCRQPGYHPSAQSEFF